MSANVAAGQMLDRYKLVREIGSGAFGSVWLAEDTWLSKKVALKIPHNQNIDFAKLLAEPKMMAALEHPNIIKLLTVEKAGGTMFMVMEFVEGVSLKSRMDGKPMDPAEAIRVTRGILEALGHAHERGVVHRDVKPANILLSPEGGIKITDFGTAHAMQSGEETVAAGTLFYMSKEQLMGKVGPASDVYSAGVILFEMLTGKLPFYDEKGARVVQKILSAEPAPDVRSFNRSVPEGLAAIVSRSLERDTSVRWKSAAELLDAIAAYEAGKPIPGAPAPARGTAARPAGPEILRMSGTFGRSHSFQYKGEFGGRGRNRGQFMLPTGIAVGSEGRMFVSDAIRGQVQILDAKGQFVRVLGEEGTLLQPGLSFQNPSALTLDSQDRIYLADTKNCRVHVFTSEGDIIAQFGRPLVVVGIHDEKGVIGFNYPRGIAIDEPEGIIYVADSGNNRIRMFNMEGKSIQTVGTHGSKEEQFDAPIGVSVDRRGRLYVADSQNFRIQVYERGLKFVGCIGRRGAGMNEFPNAPTGVTVRGEDELIVCDDSGRIRVIGNNGDFLGVVDAPKATTGIAHVQYYAVAVSATGDLFAIDENGCRIHQFSYEESKP